MHLTDLQDLKLILQTKLTQEEQEGKITSTRQEEQL